MNEDIRTFEHFPEDIKCPICGTNDDKECFLIEIDGTVEGNICQAAPIHLDCITKNLNKFRFNRDVGVIYLGADQNNDIG